jgi:hypothetical protein
VVIYMRLLLVVMHMRRTVLMVWWREKEYSAKNGRGSSEVYL